MEISYWQSRWRNQKNGWHMHTVFPLLKQYWPSLNPKSHSTVLVPLCGKSLDLDWLSQRGHYVIGVEVSKVAVKAVIKRHAGPFNHTTKGPFHCYRSSAIELWCGDFSKLKKEWLPTVNAVYDKAALIALPPEKRVRYAQTIRSLMQPQTHIVLNTFEYNQDEMPGPPFAVFKDELESLFGVNRTIQLLHEQNLFDTLEKFQRRGLQSYLREKLYYLQPR